MYKTILQKKMLFVWMMFTVNAPAIESLKTTYVWKVDDIYKKIPVLYNIYKFMQRCNWYEKLHMKFVPCPEQFISQKVQAIMTMQCTAMKWNPLFVCSKITQLHKSYPKWPHSYEAKILYMVLNVNFHLHKAKYIPFYNNFHYKTNHHICYYSTQSINALPTGQCPFCYYTPRWQKI